MLKPFTLSLSLVVALSAAGVSLAGHKSAGCDTCGIASPQGYVSPQSVIASPQGCDSGCDNGCGHAKKHCWNFKLPKISLPKCTYTYEWVLKKKKVWGHNDNCNDCGGPGVYPTSQAGPSPQGGPWAAPQAAPYAAPKAAPQAAGQSAMISAPGEMRPALAADEVPPAPTVATQSRLLQLSPSNN